MTKKFYAGQRVIADDLSDYSHDQPLEGVVVQVFEDESLINFGAHFSGHTGSVKGMGETCWFVSHDDLRVAPDTVVAKAPQAKQQTDRILAHLLAGKSITQLEAFGVYRIFRLAARIHELKSKGHKIVTTMRIDETGKQYAEYSIPPRKTVR